MIYRFRIILDAEEDIFRDIEIEATNTLEDFHNAITQAFGFDGNEMASFYLSDEMWSQGEEISLFSLDETENSSRLMSTTKLHEVVDEENNKLIYLYDFLNMWTFFIELAEIADEEDGKSYPNLLFAHGQLPESPPEKQFESDEFIAFDDNDDDFDVEDMKDSTLTKTGINYLISSF